jgi:hypothetical protein
MNLLHETILPFKDLSVNKRNILKIPKETLLVWIRSLAAIYSLRNLLTACKAVQVAIPLGELMYI